MIHWEVLVDKSKFKGPSIFEVIRGRSFDEVKVILHQHGMLIDEWEEYYLVRYNMLTSNMSLLLSNQCRGIIFRKETNEVVCYPFDKFYNSYNENADSVDEKTARALEKVDGSIIKHWWDAASTYGPMISTNGKIDAFESVFPDANGNDTTFGDLVLDAMPTKFMMHYADNKEFYQEHTLIFELTSPHNRVVVFHPETKLIHIGTRNNKTHQEIEHDLSEWFDVPKSYDLSSLEEVIKAAKALPFNEEGYVYVDAEFNRQKIKSPAYVYAHKLKGNVNSEVFILELIRTNEHDEVLGYYPEYKDKFDNVEAKYNEWLEAIRAIVMHAYTILEYDQKKFAMWAKTTMLPSLLFKIKQRGKDYDVMEFINNIPIKKLVGYVNSI